MPNEIKVTCELTIVPGGGSRQNKISLKAFGETVFDEYEDMLEAGDLSVAKKIAGAQSRLLAKWADAEE